MPWLYTFLFGISGGEILILLLLVLLLFGPKKIPEIARMIGRGMNEVKKVQREINTEIQRYSSEIEKETKEMQSEIEKITQESIQPQQDQNSTNTKYQSPPETVNIHEQNDKPANDDNASITAKYKSNNKEMDVDQKQQDDNADQLPYPYNSAGDSNKK